MTGYPAAAKRLLRETLLDAADAALEERPWAKVSMGEVAKRAGVSRQTLYNEFGGRRELAEAFVLREADRLLAGPELQIVNHPDDPRAAIAGALRTFLEAAARNRLLQSMVAEPDDGLLALVTTRDGVLLTAVERIAATITQTWPGVDAKAARRLTEVVVRLAISHATLPTAAPAATARELSAVLGPHLDELLALSNSSAAA